MERSQTQVERMPLLHSLLAAPRRCRKTTPFPRGSLPPSPPYLWTSLISLHSSACPSCAFYETLLLSTALWTSWVSMIARMQETEMMVADKEEAEAMVADKGEADQPYPRMYTTRTLYQKNSTQNLCAPPFPIPSHPISTSIIINNINNSLVPKILAGVINNGGSSCRYLLQ